MITDTEHPMERVRPRFIEPMQLALVRNLPDGGNWIYEAKLDGYRCLAANRFGNVVLWSRRGTGFTMRFPQIARACQKLPPDTLIDGEVVVVNDDRRVSFNALQYSRPSGHIQFYAFDILVHKGRDLRRSPIEQRRELLEEALRKVQYPVVRSIPFDAHPADLIRAAKAHWRWRESSLSAEVQSTNPANGAARGSNTKSRSLRNL